jgi:peptidoglycan/LPS O-acetylase OafA/YrhL
MIDPSRAVEGPTAAAPADTATPSDKSARTKREAPVQQSAPDRSLDQWRGLALVLVLISHAFHYPDRVPGVGRAGVNLFFFISGVLVYRTLSRGPPGLMAGTWSFWVRRTRRLVPTKYFYLLCMIVLVLVAPSGLISAVFRSSFFESLPSSFFYYRNYYLPPFAAVSSFTGLNENLAGHLWSLACEMQFYLLAPLIFFAGGKTWRRRAAVYGLVLALMLAGGLSVVGRNGYNPYSFQVAAWPMMAGFFAEFLRAAFPDWCAWWGKPLAWIGLASSVALVWAVLSTHHDYNAHKQVVVLAGTLLVAGCLGCYLAGIAPRGPAGNALHFLGNRTYSIYLWQQPLTIGGLMPAALHPLGSLLSIPLGALSFRFLEQPFMSKYKNRPGAAAA